jgi:hypothetical protein
MAPAKSNSIIVLGVLLAFASKVDGAHLHTTLHTRI